ncbi:laccase-14-like [Impatiens glandulifera]|uniref:laccase-14-like n=1 Tax=Impatiens glandulifera TaxID=253017 RepID=UPI001FB14742|nr:laccase-14-like [Impatiens glandulifera]
MAQFQTVAFVPVKSGGKASPRIFRQDLTLGKSLLPTTISFSPKVEDDSVFSPEIVTGGVDHGHDELSSSLLNPDDMKPRKRGRKTANARNIPNALMSYILGFLFLMISNGKFSLAIAHYKFVVKESSYTRLCSTKKILTVNGQYPGPTIYANKDDTVMVDVYNEGNRNITIHWHGVKQFRNPWSDGPAYVTQCPIQPGNKFTQTLVLTNEEGTIWWHAHSAWDRATVHGAIVVYPKINGTPYPFAKPHQDIPIILGEWWKTDINAILTDFEKSGGGAKISDALTINGQPGDLYPCSKQDTFTARVKRGFTYHLRIINVGMAEPMFFAVAGHKLTIIGTDGGYLKPIRSTYITIAPGQSIDALLTANAPNNNSYYMAAKIYSSNVGGEFDNTTTTAILKYEDHDDSSSSSAPLLPSLPLYNDSGASVSFNGKLRSIASRNHPSDVPLNISTKLIFAIAMNLEPCSPAGSCSGPNGSRLSASVNNISFVSPTIDILRAYYNNISGVFKSDFPHNPPQAYNYTADYQPLEILRPEKGTSAVVLEYNSTVELVIQGTSLVGAADHPVHLHGYSFYVVGWGFGNFNKTQDPLHYNLIDPPIQNTATVPRNGWVAIRFRANNPGVWFMHCHLELHSSLGMDMVWIVKNGQGLEAQMLPPPKEMPPC